MEEIKVALNGLAIVVVTGLIGVVANYAKLALKKISDKANAELVKIENENTRNLIQNAKDDLVDLAKNTVGAFEVNSVKQLKEANGDGKLTKDEAIMVYNSVKDNILAQLNNESKELLVDNVGDFEKYIEILIENELAKIKGQLI